MNKLAIYFNQDASKEEAENLVETVLSYISMYDMDLDVVNVVSPENIHVIYPSTVDVQQATGDMSFCLKNYNHVFAVGSDNAVLEVIDMMDKINFVEEKDDGVAISDIRGRLFDNYVKDATVVQNNPVAIEAFIDKYLDSLTNASTEKEISEVKKGLNILRQKLYEQQD